MTFFSQEIYRLVSAGLAELAQSQLAGKTPSNPLSETHFFSAWVTKSIKQQRFDRCVLTPLRNWQRQARTLGANAQLKQQFSAIARTYAPLFNAKVPDDNLHRDNESGLAVTRAQIESIVVQLSAEHWLVTTDVVIERKLSLKSSGASSLVVCARQLAQVFGGNGQLVKPLSFFVRGDSQALIDLCYRHQILLHQVSDYKSRVKYHGEYIIYPENNGVDIPCIPGV